MDKLIEHLFSLNIPGFFLALALLYELAISLKLKFGRSWLYKEIRESLQNPAARKLLLHDLRSRPSAANLKYVNFLLKSHDWLNYYLDSTRNFNQRTLLWWRQRVSLRRWYQYLTGRSFVLCFALATLYPLIFFLLRFLLSGHTGLISTNIAPLPVFVRWLIIISFVISVITPFLYYHPLRILIAKACYRIVINNTLYLRKFINERWPLSYIIIHYISVVMQILIIALIVLIPFLILYFSEVLLRDSGLALALIFAITFLISCTYCKKQPSTLFVSFMLSLIAVLAFGLGVTFLLNSNLSAIMVFTVTFITITFLTAVILGVSRMLNSKNTPFYAKVRAKFDEIDIRISAAALPILVYAYIYLVPICTSDLSTICSPPTSPANGLSVFLLLVIALPPINALLDWLSLALSRYCFDKVLLHSRWTQWLYITLDLIGAIATLFVLYTLIFWVLGRFEQLFPNSVGDVAAMRDLWWRSPWHPDVLWITIMGATTMLMTLLHIFTSLWGLFFWLPQDLRQRRRYARQLAAESKRVPILPGEKYPASELHHQIAHFLTIGRDRTIVWGFCIGGAMLSWIIGLFYPHIPFLST